MVPFHEEHAGGVPLGCWKQGATLPLISREFCPALPTRELEFQSMSGTQPVITFVN